MLQEGKVYILVPRITYLSIRALRHMGVNFFADVGHVSGSRTRRPNSRLSFKHRVNLVSTARGFDSRARMVSNKAFGRCYDKRMQRVRKGCAPLKLLILSGCRHVLWTFLYVVVFVFSALFWRIAPWHGTLRPGRKFGMSGANKEG